jgi:hypothetical protein
MPPQPYPAWLCLVTAPYPPVGTRLPWTVAGAWTVFAVWAVLALVIAAAAVDRRDQ